MPGRFRSAFAALAIAVGVASLPVLADERQTDSGERAAQARHPAKCVCRAPSGTFDVGESACLRTATGARVALCGMVLNNTSWHFTEQPCPES